MAILLLLALLLPSASPLEDDDAELHEVIPLDELLTPRDLGRFYQRTRYRDRIEIFRKAIDTRADRLGGEIDKRNLAVVFRTLAEVRGLAYYALQISLLETSDREKRHREVRRLEIRLRRFVDQLEGQKLGVPLENREPFDLTREKVEELRNQLLRQLFGAAISEGGGAVPPARFHSLAPAVRPAMLAAQPLLDIDKFTEDEYRKVQYSQELVKRVDAFLEIAERRLDEVERRRLGVEEEEEEIDEEEDPLLFHTYTDLLHAYGRAVDGIMTNIDERAELRTATERDIRRSLRKLAEKVEEFLPRLVAMEDLVEEQRDERLLRKYREVLRSTEIARKGARYGLGVVGD